MPSRADSEQRAASSAQHAETAGFELGGRTWTSRLIVGTGGFRSLEQLERAIAASGTEIVTVALRRVEPGAEVTPSPAEVAANSRSASARLRAAAKTGDAES